MAVDIIIGADALQTVIFNTVNALGLTVYDDVPETEDFPYVRIGRDSFSFDGSASHCAFVANANIDIYSDYDGMKEVKQISSDIASAISSINTSANGFNVRFISIESIDYEEHDEVIRHVSIQATFRVVKGD